MTAKSKRIFCIAVTTLLCEIGLFFSMLNINAGYPIIGFSISALSFAIGIPGLYSFILLIAEHYNKTISHKEKNMLLIAITVIVILMFVWSSKQVFVLLGGVAFG